MLNELKKAGSLVCDNFVVGLGEFGDEGALFFDECAEAVLPCFGGFIVGELGAF